MSTISDKKKSTRTAQSFYESRHGRYERTELVIERTCEDDPSDLCTNGRKNRPLKEQPHSSKSYSWARDAREYESDSREPEAVLIHEKDNNTSCVSGI